MIYTGTCSWKYQSWKNLVYFDLSGNLLQSYARQYKTVEIDQWFWSLFNQTSPKLPNIQTAREYAESVPSDFKFTIKAPNSLTLTHFYPRKKGELTDNPFFLSAQLFQQFIDSIEPLLSKTAMLIFQFEYLNRKKMPSLEHFLNVWSDFLEKIDSSVPIAIETRNPNFLTPLYFQELNKLQTRHCLLEGYFLPPVSETLASFFTYLDHDFIIRLHGPDRSEMESLTGKQWNTIVRPMDDELAKIIKIIRDLRSKNLDIYINVNNHYEGSAPLTIKKIESLLHRP